MQSLEINKNMKLSGNKQNGLIKGTFYYHHQNNLAGIFIIKDLSVFLLLFNSATIKSKTKIVPMLH